MKDTLPVKAPVGVVGFFDDLWNNHQIRCGSSTMNEQTLHLKTDAVLSLPGFVGMIRFYSFKVTEVDSKVKMSAGHFVTKNSLAGTHRPLSLGDVDAMETWWHSDPCGAVHGPGRQAE